MNIGTAWNCLGWICNSDEKVLVKVRSDPRFVDFLMLTSDLIVDSAKGGNVVSLKLFAIQHYSNIIHSLAKLDVPLADASTLSPLLNTLCSHTLPLIISSGKPQEVANTAWSLAKMFGSSKHNFDLSIILPFFLALDKKGLWLVENGTCQALSNTAWSFATLSLQAPNFFEVLESNTHGSVRILREGKPQEIANTGKSTSSARFTITM